nr:UDP-3-O-acyl-N-acetylglucosamine deacetylase [Nitrosomonas nitrosa]
MPSAENAVTWSYATTVIRGDGEFTFIGPQLTSNDQIRMRCVFRGDGKPARFLVSGQTIEAVAENITEHELRGMTSIGIDGITVRHTEHILSALYGMNALDTDIHLEFCDTVEQTTEISVPVSNLNSRDFVNAIVDCFPDILRRKSNSIVHIDVPKYYREDPNDPTSAFAIFAPLHKLHITAHIDFPFFWGQQIYAQEINPIDYAKSIAWARSFFGSPYPHKSDWAAIRKRFPGLVRERINHARSIMLDFSARGWITPPIVNTEPVRHKMLDFIGDLALIGRPLTASIYIFKPSHKFNRECVRQLRHELLDAY